MRFPFPQAPNGWFHLLWSDEVARGQSTRLHAFGTELVATRSAAGEVVVTGAHDWRSARRGRSLRSPPPAPWPVREHSGIIFVHHHHDGAAPQFEIPEIPEHTSRKWIPVGRLEFVFRSHVQEVIENSVDLGHFELLHGYRGHPLLKNFSTDGHTFSVSVESRKVVMGIAVPSDLTIAYCGMGVGLGRTEQPFPFLNVATCLPLDGDRLRQRFTMYAEAPRLPVVRHALAAFLRWHVWKDVKDEIAVLDHKQYLERPVLAAGDGPIMKVRAWCRQFYPLVLPLAATG